MTNLPLFLISLLLVLGFTQSTPVESSTKDSSKSLAPAVSKTPVDVTLSERAISTVSSTNNDTVTDEEKQIEIPDEEWTYENKQNDTRRILYSKPVNKGKRPYMVYLQLTPETAKAHKYRGWLCGGVILSKSYVLTSAACVEDAEKFYIVSGTTKFVDSFDYQSDDCVCNNRRRVVWKCIPKNYKFDFRDTLKWSSNDIAIVKVDKPFKFGIKEKGCEFATQCILYNNVSRELEEPDTKGFIAGWGAGNNFREGMTRRAAEREAKNAKVLQDAKVCIMDNAQCAKKWAEKFRPIIKEYMICTKDLAKRISEICDKKYATCKEVEARRVLELMEDNSTVHAANSGKIFNIDLGRHLQDPNDYTARRATIYGGFCENDHGGPLIVKHKGTERVIGIISACKIDPKTHSCHGPFLYTSVFKNRQFISCAITKDIEDENGESSCRRVFRTGITHEEYTVDWNGYTEGEQFLRANAEDPKALLSNGSAVATSKKDDKLEKTKEKDAEKEPEKQSTINQITTIITNTTEAIKKKSR